MLQRHLIIDLDSYLICATCQAHSSVHIPLLTLNLLEMPTSTHQHARPTHSAAEDEWKCALQGILGSFSHWLISSTHLCQPSNFRLKPGSLSILIHYKLQFSWLLFSGHLSLLKTRWPFRPDIWHSFSSSDLWLSSWPQFIFYHFIKLVYSLISYCRRPAHSAQPGQSIHCALIEFLS